ncbi:MAG: helix-turn-helix domain-containing protein [Candidatus Omnitrophica bacterium]|nr:helix-turn-helix domain-containing protein [Candidatus Omnitrophota bacterium]
MANDIKFNDILNMSALGDKLREVREGKNITLGQAQKQTRIHQAVLKALEDGKCDSILNPTYVKSFLKKYADYLGVDSRQVMSEYKRLCPEAESETVNKLPEPRDASKGPSSVFPFIRLIVVIVVAVAMITLALGKVMPYFRKQGISRPVPVSKVKQPATRSKSSKKVSKENAAPKEDAGIVIPKNVQLKLLLKVNKTVMIKMRTDGVLLFERVLSKGTAEIFTAEKSINIYAADGSSIELVLNGKQMGSPGKGILKNIEITRTGIKIK